MHAIDVQTRRFTRDEYYQLADLGWFAGQRVILLDGEIVQMPAHGHQHFVALNRIDKLLQHVFGPRYWVRAQGPLDLGDSQPEPDIAVVAGPLESHRAHPTTALLVVEIADSSLRADRQLAGLYASAGVADYWIVNLQQKQLEVHRQPIPDATADFGHTYAERRVLTPGQVVEPLELPGRPLRIADFFE